MVVTIVNNLSGALFDLADVDQHSGNRIRLTGKNKVSDIIASGAVDCAAFLPEEFAILLGGKTWQEQSPRGRKFDAFTDGQEHDPQNTPSRNCANSCCRMRSRQRNLSGLIR